ncbi:MAG: hypothetical protein DRP78_05225, partial [Candidatus Omnitrophota bacterium]
MNKFLDNFKILLFFILFFLIHQNIVIAQDIPDNTLIATVNGNEITYKEIVPCKEHIEYMKFNYKKIHNQAITEEELKKYLEDTEKHSLANKIRNIVKNQAIKTLGIIVTQEEIENKIEDMIKLIENAGISEKQAFKEVQEKSFLMIKALKIWQKNQDKSTDIYKRLLFPRNISLDEWQIWRINYSTPEKLQELQKFIPKTIEDMRKNSYKSAKKDLLWEKTRNFFGKNIVATDKEINEYHKKKYKCQLGKIDLTERQSNESKQEYK